jgi:predicted neutral ceramidase superfamily lipid hydrolase
MECKKCGTEFEGNFCPECGTKIKSLSNSKFNKKAILYGIITLFVLLIIRNIIQFDTLILWAAFMIVSFFISGIITGYTVNSLYLKDAATNGLIVGIIFTLFTLIAMYSQYPILFAFIYLSLLMMLIASGIGGSIGGYIKIQRELKNKFKGEL